jgi:NAD(P)-dependent dehydrogenase (short-subunit alcohol dehydrogenase family)
MRMESELDGLRALVTGGTKGIGQAVVARLREGGATVLAIARVAPRDVPDADHFVRQTSRPRTDALLSPGSCARLGRIDILVHVVGGSSAPAGGFAVLDDGEWQRALDLNLFPAVRLDRALLPAMLEQGSGVIIHITSIQRQLPLPDATIAYAAAKAALANYSKGLSKEVSPKGVRVVRVSPGWVETDGAVGLIDELAGQTSHRLRRRSEAVDGFTRRDSDRPTGPTARSCGSRRLSRISTRSFYQRHRVCDRWWDGADRLTPIRLALRSIPIRSRASAQEDRLSKVDRTEQRVADTTRFARLIQGVY